MDDEYDIYGDLEGFEAKAAQDNKVVQELKAQIAELRSQIAAKEHEKQETIARNTVLLENISSLLVTAKAELKRKDAVIADIRRDRDNAAFRRTKPVHTHDRGTQTRLVKLLSTGVQASTTTTEGDGHHGHRVKKEKEVDWHWERNRVEEDHRRDRDRFREKDRVPVRERLGNRGMVRQELNQVRGGRRVRNRTHEEERERDRQARHGPRSPDAERMRSAVRFRSPVRVKTDDSSVPDSASDIELSRAFIPMNRKELDRYVKEIGRDQNRSPVIAEVTKPDKNSKPPNDVPPSDPWDTRPRKKIKTPKKHRKRTSKTPIKQKSPKIIQSDEIGTTACGSSSLSPVKSEDIEQRMSALHGHPPLPEPPELTIPPPEPPIIEHVPELPLEDDAKLNDSRELKIIESSDEQQIIPVQAPEPTVVEDEPNTSAETVIERSTSMVEDGEDGDLEDGEIITPAPSPAEPPSKEEIAEAKRNATIAKAVAQLAQETEAKSNQEQPVVAQTNHHTKEKPSKPKRKRVDPPAEEIPPPKQQELTSAEQEDNRTAKHKRNLNGAFELPNVPESHEQQQRRNTFSGAIANEKVKRKQRLSEPTSEKGHKKKSETLQELFGSEDDDSFVVAPTLPPPPPKEESNRIEEVGGGKRKRTESVGEGLDSKKRKSEGVEIREEVVKGDQLIELKKSDEVSEKEDGGDVPRKEENTVVQTDTVAAENEIESVSSKEELETKNDSTSGSENTEENIISQDESGPKEDGSVDSDGNKDSLESESVPDVANESISGSEPATNGGDVPENKIDPVANDDEVASEKIDEPQVMEVIQEVEIKPPEGPPTHPHEVIVVSNKYCEYRIEEDNEAETTFYVTRKKKKKNKSKSRNASLNASGAN